MIWRSQASFRVRCVVLTVAIALPSFATLSFAGSKRSRVLHAHPTTNIGTVSATSTAAAAPAQIPRPRFDAPPLFAANGRNVGIGGLYSMAKGDFNGDGIPDFAAVGFACANGVVNSAALYLGTGGSTFRARSI